jgi:hypothetical protein
VATFSSEELGRGGLPRSLVNSYPIQHLTNRSILGRIFHSLSQHTDNRDEFKTNIPT